MLNLIFSLIGFFLLLIGLASMYVLYLIGGKSDGPGALIFYIGAFIGLGGAWVVFSAMRTTK
ncbi:MAG: hypothetical protein ACKV2V_17835 [Blastocatellia bacterium]